MEIVKIPISKEDTHFNFKNHNMKEIDPFILRQSNENKYQLRATAN